MVFLSRTDAISIFKCLVPLECLSENVLTIIINTPTEKRLPSKNALSSISVSIMKAEVWEESRIIKNEMELGTTS